MSRNEKSAPAASEKCGAPSSERRLWSSALLSEQERNALVLDLDGGEGGRDRADLGEGFGRFLTVSQKSTYGRIILCKGNYCQYVKQQKSPDDH